MTSNSWSPYSKTSITSKYISYLDVWEYRDIPKSDDDEFYTLEPKYQYRPDLLAYDKLGESRLWWVFSVRNPDIFVDPIEDMKVGISFYIPRRIV